MEVDISFDDINYHIDMNTKFAKLDDGKEQWRDVEDERFINWMLPSGGHPIRKLWGIIETDINEGDYQLRVNSRWGVEDLDIKKYFILSTVNAMGGKNIAFASVYIFTAIVAYLLAISLAILHCMRAKFESKPLSFH